EQPDQRVAHFLVAVIQSGQRLVVRRRALRNRVADRRLRSRRRCGRLGSGLRGGRGRLGVVPIVGPGAQETQDDDCGGPPDDLLPKRLINVGLRIPHHALPAAAPTGYCTPGADTAASFPRPPVSGPWWPRQAEPVESAACSSAPWNACCLPAAGC